MKINFENKRYDSEKCKSLAHTEHFNNGNYSGTTYLMVASDGEFLFYRETNGQDLHLDDIFYRVNINDMERLLNNMDMSEDEEKLAVELNLIELVQ